MSSAKPGKVDEIHEARKRSSEELTSQRQKAVVDANATDARTQNWTQYSDQNHHYGPPVTARQINNTNPDGTYARDKVNKTIDNVARLCPMTSYFLVRVGT